MNLFCLIYNFFKKDLPNTYIAPSDFYKLPKLPHELSFLHINCRSISNKVQDIITLNSLMKAKIIAVTETWLNPDTSESIFIPDYSFNSVCRCSGRGGGVGLFIHYSIQFSSLTVPLDVTTFEHLFVKLRIHHNSIIIGVIYRPPNTNLQKFNEEFRLLLDQTVRCQSCVLLGDFNIDMSAQIMNSAIHEFQNITSTHCLQPKINLPTRITPTSATIIDNVFTNIFDKKSTVKIIVDDISDHLPIYFAIEDSKQEPMNVFTQPFREQNNENKNRFIVELGGLDWSDVLQHCGNGDASIAYSSFIKTYLRIYDICFPVTHKENKSSHFRKAWMTPGLLKSCRKKNILYKKYLCNPTADNKLKFTCYRNKFKKVKDAAITQFFSNKFRLYEKSCKKTWDLINHLMNRGSRHSLPCAFFNTNGQILTSPKEIANSFNAYFSNIGNELAKKITPNNLDFRTYLKYSMFLSPVTSEEIISISKTIKSSHSTDCDGIDPTLASISVPLIAHILASLINCSFNSGTSQTLWRLQRSSHCTKLTLRILLQTIGQYQSFHIFPSTLKKQSTAELSRFLTSFRSSRITSSVFVNITRPICPSRSFTQRSPTTWNGVNPQLESFWTWLKLLIRWITTFCLRNYSIMASEINAYCGIKVT